MAGTKRKVSFYKLSLEKFTLIKERNTVRVELLSNEKLLQYFRKLYDEKTTQLRNGNKAINVSTSAGDYVVEIVEFDDKHTYMKIGRQNPSDTVALRDTQTLETEIVPMRESQLLELFTYCLLDFETGIISYIGINGAPRISAIRSLFDNCFFKEENVAAKLAAIMTDDILQTLVHKSIISKLTLTVAIPDDSILSDTLGLNESAFDSLRNVKTRTASYKLVATRNKNIFESSSKLAELIATIKERFGDRVQGLTANAKDAHENSQAYDLLHYNFTKTVVLNTKNTAELNEQQFKDALHETYTTYKDELLRYCQI